MTKTEDIPSSSTLTFDGILSILNNDNQDNNSDNINVSNVSKTLDSFQDILKSGKTPYLLIESSSTALTTQSENKDYIDFITKKLDLDPTKVSNLIDLYSKKISMDLSNSKILSYYLSIILQQQSLYFEASLNIINSEISIFETLKNSIISNGFNIIEQLIENIKHINTLQTKLSASNIEIDLLLSNNLNCLLISILNYFVHIIIKSEKGFMTKTVISWFKLLEETNFFVNISSSNEVNLTVESLATLITLLFLDLDFNFGSVNNKSTFMSESSNLVDITNCLLNTNSNPIILYAWSIILHRQHTILEINKDNKLYQTYIDELNNSSLKNIENVYLSFVEQALELNICESLINCNNIVSYDPTFQSILGSFVISFIPYIEPTYELISTISTILRNSSNKIIEKFFNSESTNELLILLKAKMPISINQYLELISINSNLAVEELRLLPTFMTTIESSKFNTVYMIDDQQPELIRLINDFQISLPFESNNELSLLMKKDSKAQILSNKNNQSLVMFIYEYNGWSLLGRILKNLSVKISLTNQERDNTRNVILKSLNNIFKDIDERVLKLIFNSMSSFINVEKNDIIDIIFRIFDQALLLKNIELLCHCLSLFITLSEKGYSFRIWSYIFKSDLLSFKSNGGLALDILDKVETINGSYKFLILLLKLGNKLINSALVFNDNINIKLKSQVMEYFTIFKIQIFENFFNWKYSNEFEKFEIGNLIISFLNKIIEFEISLDNDEDRESILPVFQSSFKKIVSRFLILDIHDTRSVNPLLSTINYLSNSNLALKKLDKSGLLYNEWIHKSTNFSIGLIKLRSTINPKLISTFEKQLYSLLKSLIDSYVLNNGYKILILNLLTQLVRSSPIENPPSMLTHLNDSYSQILLNNLYFDISNNSLISSTDLKIFSFKFISSVLENNQKGLSLFLITGNNIQNGKASSSTLNDTSIYKLLKNSVMEISNYDSEYTYNLLNSVSSCIGVWLNLCSDNEDLKFIEKVLQIIEVTSNKNINDLNIWEIEILSKSVEIISLYLFVSHGKNKSCEEKIFKLLNSESFILSLEAKFKIKHKDDSLMKIINENMKSIFGDKFKVSQFLKSNKLVDLFENNYDFELLNTFFAENSLDFEKIKPNLLEEENNMKLIESQIHLAKSFGGLITCYCNVNSKSINPEYCLLASSLLKINFEEGITFDIYDEIYKARIELSFLIVLTVSKLLKPIKDTTLISILTSALKLLELREINLFQGLTSLNVEYYKPLLRILLILISMIKTTEFVSEYSSTLIEVFRNIICKSINILFNSIRNQALSVYNQDFSTSTLINKQIDDILIILSLVQDFFKLNLSSNLDSEISNILISSGAYRAIAQMYTSSHLIKIEKEEIFMEYSISFIYEFIQRKSMAEKLINEGIFNLLTESPIALIIQKGHISPYSNNLIIVRLHKLWVKRILPIVLTLSAHFGDHIIFLICKFALTFKKQFKFTIQAWLETDSLISPSIIEETEQLVLFAKLLSSLDCYNYVASQLGKDVDDVKLVPGLDTIQERKVFVNALSYLLTHPKYLAMKVRTVDGEITINELTEELKFLKESLIN